MNVIGGELEPCGTDPITGFYRDGCCTTGPEDLGSHTVCAVMTTQFLEHQRAVGNDLSTPIPAYQFPGLEPGDRWCVVAARWLQAYEAGVAPPVVLAATDASALDIIPLDALREHAVDVPSDPELLGLTPSFGLTPSWAEVSAGKNGGHGPLLHFLLHRRRHRAVVHGLRGRRGGGVPRPRARTPRAHAGDPTSPRSPT